MPINRFAEFNTVSHKKNSNAIIAKCEDKRMKPYNSPHPVAKSKNFNSPYIQIWQPYTIMLTFNSRKGNVHKEFTGFYLFSVCVVFCGVFLFCFLFLFNWERITHPQKSTCIIQYSQDQDLCSQSALQRKCMFSLSTSGIY